MLASLLPDNRAHLFAGDCLDLLPLIPANSIDAIVTDPPYGLRFMGRDWDRGVPGVKYWEACFRVCKPGAYLLSFGGTRTYHRMACAVEDAGFEIRDQIQWLYGQGMPKSRACLKPAAEPIVLARKPGNRELNIEACRIELIAPRLARSSERSASGLTGSGGATTYGKYAVRGSIAVGETSVGRWPANVVHDGSDEVLECFPDAPGQQVYVGPEHGDRPSRGIYGDFGPRPPSSPREDQGSASRFFYCAKASKSERNGSKHPTIKPVALMQWLVRLVTPPNGIVLDPFAGTGATGIAAIAEGFRTVLCEKDAVSQEDIRKRFAKL
jgi:site-specific DNA-methyltransferase (adenine-specific)